MIQNTDMRLESGTCNVCSAPCSSCMHLNRTLMGSKAEEFSDENCRIGEANRYSNDEGDGSSLGSRACERLKDAVSETSDMPSVYSSHDSQSENAKNKQALSGNCQDSKFDDSISCISRTSNANLVNSNDQISSDRINICCTSASVSHVVAEGSGSGPSNDMSGLSENISSKDTAIPENLSEFCVENVDSSLTKERTPIVSGEKSPADKEGIANSSAAKVSIEICPKSEADADNDDAKDEDHKYSAESAHDGPHEKVEKLAKSPGLPELQSGDDSDESDIEHDVKVCDICGDAGREDLLAICSRCSDGAEHTYCMREMLQKLPEGDWLCEECKYAEEAANQRLDSEVKKNLKDISTSQVSGKRPSESLEVATAAKRQALESSTGSPKASSPKRIVPLSREPSFKNFLDKGKVKPGQQNPMRNHHAGEDIELARSHSTGPRSQTARSTLLKSNSFNNFSSKPRVKPVDEVPQKQKGGGEHISKNIETPAGMISKSMSFKSSNLGRSSATESKVKMLSPKSGTVQDLKSSRHAKESSVFDRKSLSRIDRPVACSKSDQKATPRGETAKPFAVTCSKSDQKVTPRGETAKPSAFNNNREFKVNQDGKLSSSSKSVNNISSKILEPQVSSERISNSVDETQQDRLPRSRETANQVDKTEDSSSDHVRSGVTSASKNSFCRKCKDFGHAAECCTVSGYFGSEVSVTATSSSKVETHKGNRVKAAIQAALLIRRPEIHKKKEGPDQTNEFPSSDTGLKCEVMSQNQLFGSSTLKKDISAEETNVRQEIVEASTFETSKYPSANFCPTDFCSQLKKSDSGGLNSGKPVVRNLPHHTLAVPNVLSKMSAVPEYQYIWQGVFKVHRNGKPPDLYTGIQAHLSSCASPKVREVVNKFLPEISLNEVSRLSTWPSQFHQGGAKEDNIALYFFAEDIESYGRHYKGLLDHMIRNDLALRGTLDGVELLIFTSNQLPENSQRWNTLFFLWGIFRGRRINHSDSAQNICIPTLNVAPTEKDFPTAVMTLSETRCSPKRMDEESARQDHIMRESVPEHGQYRVSKPPEAMGEGTSVCSRTVETKTNYDISVNLENSLSSRVLSVGCRETDNLNISKNKILERTNDDENQQRPKRKQQDDLNFNVEATSHGDLTVKEVNCQLPNDKKVQHIDLSDAVVATSAVICPKRPWTEVNGQLDDRESPSKRLQTGFSGIYGCYNSGTRESFNSSFASRVNDIGVCSLVEDKGCKESYDEKIIHEDFGTMGRTFSNDSQSVLNNATQKEPHDCSDQFQVGAPNLELALGGESKSSQRGMLPFFVGAGDVKNNQERTPDTLADERQDDSTAASLSLSLSFPSSNNEHIRPVSKSEPLPDGHHVNTSLLLFGSLIDK